MSDLMADLRAAVDSFRRRRDGEDGVMVFTPAHDFVRDHGERLLALLEAGKAMRDELYEDTLLEYGREAAEKAVREYDEAAGGR